MHINGLSKMGAVCCCFRLEDLENFLFGSAVLRQCTCLRCLIQQFANMYFALFRRRQVHSIPSSIPGATPMASQVVPISISDTSMSDSFRPPPRPLPYDADPRCSRYPRDGLISRREKTSSHSSEESELLRSSSSTGLDPLGNTAKWNGSGSVGGSKPSCDPSEMHPIVSVIGDDSYFLASSEDEDVCPTCLEEYTPENPKIMTQCSHHFHLGCIYEWMERSDYCPVCGKEMVLDDEAA